MSNTTFTPPFHGYDVAAIANEFLRLAKKEGKSLTNMQLQKLPYIAHGWSLALRNKPLVKQTVEVWPYGPVYRDLYDELKIYGAGTVSDYIKYTDIEEVGCDEVDYPYFAVTEKPVEASLNDDDRQLIDAVWEKYKKYDGLQLSSLTHQYDTPWSKSKEEGKTTISNDLIQEHYSSLRKKNQYEAKE